MKTYRVAIIGLGRMGSTIDEEVVGFPAVTLPYSIAATCRASNRLELVAGCDLLPEKREAFRLKWGVEALYGDYREMIEKERPDLVAVCTKGDVHAELGVGVAEAAVPMMYLEKVMASSMAEADTVRDACVEAGTVFNTGVVKRFTTSYRLARKLVEDGEIGEPKAVVFYGDASVLHIHVHSIDTASYLLGDPGIAAVRGELRPPGIEIVNNRLDEDPKGTYHVRFRDGTEASSVPMGPAEYEVMGTEGSLRILNNGTSVTIRKSAPVGLRWHEWAESTVPDFEPRSAVLTCLEDLVESYESGRQTGSPVEHSHEVTEACLALVESHRLGGRWVELPIENRELYVFHV